MSIIRIEKRIVGENFTGLADVPFYEEYQEKTVFFLGIRVYSYSYRLNACKDNEKEIGQALRI